MARLGRYFLPDQFLPDQPLRQQLAGDLLRRRGSCALPLKRD
jgi:hypothetical protein